MQPALLSRVLLIGAVYDWLYKELMAPGAMSLPGGKLWNLSDHLLKSFYASRQWASSGLKKVEVEHTRA